MNANLAIRRHKYFAFVIVGCSTFFIGIGVDKILLASESEARRIERIKTASFYKRKILLRRCRHLPLGCVWNLIPRIRTRHFDNDVRGFRFVTRPFFVLGEDIFRWSSLKLNSTNSRVVEEPDCYITCYYLFSLN